MGTTLSALRRGLLRGGLLLALAATLVAGPAQARHERGGDAPAALAQSVEHVDLAELPPEARDTLQRIRRGGPFPYPRKDGSVFGNFERRLPPQPRGYYREFTVPTPGERDRGARRIVAGGGNSRGDSSDFSGTARSGEYYYSGDHYRTFRRIRE